MRLIGIVFCQALNRGRRQRFCGGRCGDTGEGERERKERKIAEKEKVVIRNLAPFMTIFCRQKVDGGEQELLEERTWSRASGSWVGWVVTTEQVRATQSRCHPIPCLSHRYKLVV